MTGKEGFPKFDTHPEFFSIFLCTLNTKHLLCLQTQIMVPKTGQGV